MPLRIMRISQRNGTESSNDVKLCSKPIMDYDLLLCCRHEQMWEGGDSTRSCINRSGMKDSAMMLDFREALWKRFLHSWDCILVVRHILFEYELVNKRLTYKSLHAKKPNHLQRLYTVVPIVYILAQC